MDLTHSAFWIARQYICTLTPPCGHEGWPANVYSHFVSGTHGLYIDIQPVQI